MVVMRPSEASHPTNNPAPTIVPSVQKIRIKNLAYFIPKDIATSGRPYMAIGIPVPNISINALAKDSPDPLGNIPPPNIPSPTELATLSKRNNAKIILKIQYPTHIKPSHCTTCNAGGFGSSCPPFTLALCAVLIIRTSPIISPSFLLPAFLSHGRESGASSFRGTAQLLTQAKCRWHLHYVTVALQWQIEFGHNIPNAVHPRKRVY